MAELIVSDYELENQIDEVRTRYNTASTLRLFTNNITPDAGTVEADFTEAAWNTYVAVDLGATNDWGAPAQDAEGEWSMQTSLHEFPPPTSGGPFNCYGAYVEDGTEVIVSGRFDGAPFVMQVGGLALRVRIDYEHKALYVVT